MTMDVWDPDGTVATPHTPRETLHELGGFLHWLVAPRHTGALPPWELSPPDDRTATEPEDVHRPPH